ncbi:hypothetical protein PVAP13_5NG632029 [Panicum virgatum]|uniref:GRF-type domain-containing protein n=1 Tax=Panicum virgatum TaxID=38727 RepID=A0A8T0S4C8_PANVG|nr:hypothetical protein PVAP13_5NG632029 [Panicum virgatum]
MASQSSVSAPDPRLSEELPLITCTECGRKKVLRLKSRQEWSFGQVFYCCPMHKRDGTGCPFWFWKEDYVEHLKKIGILNGGEWSRKGNIKDDDEKMMLGNGGTSRKEEDSSAEVVRLLRSICMLCYCILVVQVVMLFVHLLKR